MAAPTLVAVYQGVDFSSTTTPKTVAVTTQAGDRVAVLVCSENSDGSISTPTGNGLTYTSQQAISVADYCAAGCWVATDSTGGTAWTLSVGCTGSGFWGFIAFVYRDSDGFGASSKTNVSSGAPSLALTTTAANSAIVAIVGDWAALDGATRTWRTINAITPTAGNGEEVYYRNVNNYGVYAAEWSDAGAAGAQTVGMTLPSAQKYSIIALEVKGVSAAAVVPERALVAPSPAVTRAAVW